MKIHKVMKIQRGKFLIPAMMLALSACASVPARSLLPLTRIDFATTDLKTLRVAVRMMDPIRPRASGVVMDVIVRIEGQPDQQSSILLHRIDDEAGQSSIPPSRWANATSHVFRLSTEEIARFEAIRLMIRNAKENGRKGSLSLGIASREFCQAGHIPPGPILMTTYLLTSETGSYITLTEDLDLRSDHRIAKGLNQLDACQKETPAKPFS